MKKLFIGLVLLGSMMATSAYSQSDQRSKGPGGGPEPDYNKLKTELTLTDEQVTSWKNHEAQYKTKFEELRKNTSATEEEKRTQMKALRTSKESDLKNILTEEQYTKYSTRTTPQQNNKGQKGQKK